MSDYFKCLLLSERIESTGFFLNVFEVILAVFIYLALGVTILNFESFFRIIIQFETVVFVSESCACISVGRMSCETTLMDS